MQTMIQTATSAWSDTQSLLEQAVFIQSCQVKRKPEEVRTEGLRDSTCYAPLIVCMTTIKGIKERVACKRKVI